jgi:methyltransferase family protein
MLAQVNLPKIIELTQSATHVLDVGGGASPLNTATHVIDCSPFEEAASPLLEGRPLRFTADTWTVADVCDGPWPYPNGYFDFAFCSHLLEDVRDPVFVCRELMRVSKAGYIETPSRLREIYHPKSGYLWRRVLGRPTRVGYGHHRWFVEQEPGGLVFTTKTLTSIHGRDFFITPGELRRPLKVDDLAMAYFWEGTFSARERLIIKPGETEADLREFKRRALASIA